MTIPTGMLDRMDDIMDADLDEDLFEYWYLPDENHPKTEEEAIDRFWAGTE